MDLFISFIIDLFKTLAHWGSNLMSISFWTELLQTYQYIIVIAGALLEGEMVLMLAGGAAYHGYMDLYWIMVIAFFGALLHDSFLFFVGRIWGERLLQRHGRFQKHFSQVISWVQKYDTYFIMSFRFIYGIRTLTPLVVGSGPITFKRYFSLILISAAIWSIIVSYIGYSCALALEALVQHFDQVKKYLGLGLVVILALIFVFFKMRRASKKN